ncbi:DR1 protein [macacine betaherpesvirus 9]|uniref:DR1 protein n=1 Tax=macacine betaherpesvirus 9 TaxID=2560568 RepID=A0A192XNT3_9BETA|nr:protein DR1 [macacine betaherpesvirus 9]YP_009253993.1 DR1 protein [macacine betaherpesvirus 9]ANC96541.1 protein DR1 [macacine betaherpesvirus 9]ANC96542.1 DR1 protein [macacine betaherpesvirus 9]
MARPVELACLRASVARFWWLFLARHRLALVRRYLVTHRLHRLPLPWPPEECLSLDPDPYAGLHDTLDICLRRGWPHRGLTRAGTDFDPRPYFPTATVKLLPLGTVRFAKPPPDSNQVCSWLTGTSPLVILLQGPDGSLYCHDVFRGRLYLISHSVSIFLKLGLRHCEPVYTAPRWRHVQLPKMWIPKAPASRTLTQTLAVAATHGLGPLYTLLQIHRGVTCSLIHPVHGHKLDMILTHRSFREAPSRAVMTSVTAQRMLDRLCGHQAWLPIGYLVQMPHIHIAISSDAVVTAVDVRKNFLWRIADDALLLLVTGSLLLLSRPTDDLGSWRCLETSPPANGPACLEARSPPIPTYPLTINAWPSPAAGDGHASDTAHATKTVTRDREPREVAGSNSRRPRPSTKTRCPNYALEARLLACWTDTDTDNDTDTDRRALPRSRTFCC